jgi:uncharacterized protein YodC (DUF2158 family)
MSEEQFQVGDEVFLKSGNTPMTVNELKPDGTVEVIYQQGGTTKREVYKPEVLRKKQARQGPRFRLAAFRKGF